MLDVYWVDAWDEAEQEPVACAVRLSREPLPSLAEALRARVRLAVPGMWRYGPGEIVVLDEAGRRVDRVLRPGRPVLAPG